MLLDSVGDIEPGSRVSLLRENFEQHSDTDVVVVSSQTGTSGMARERDARLWACAAPLLLVAPKRKTPGAQRRTLDQFALPLSAQAQYRARVVAVGEKQYVLFSHLSLRILLTSHSMSCVIGYQQWPEAVLAAG